jgi:hypothetical protein
MPQRTYLWILGALAALGGLSQTGDDKIDLKCDSGSSAPQCPAGSANGVLLVAKTTIRWKQETSNSISWGAIQDAYSQVMAFRRGRAPSYKKDLTWQSAAKTIELTYRDRVALPVKVWVICPAENPDGTCKALTPSGETYLKNFRVKANTVLNAERVGVRLVSATSGFISDETQKPDNPVGYKNFDSAKCPEFFEVVKKLGKVASGAINIYLVLQMDGSPARGVNCSNDEAQWAVVGHNADWSTILHEIGHSLKLDDIDSRAATWDTDPKENFMYSNTDESTRKFWTEGQIFRAHRNDASAINSFAGRPLEFYCGMTNQAAEDARPPCPKLEARIWPDN